MRSSTIDRISVPRPRLKLARRIACGLVRFAVVGLLAAQFGCASRSTEVRPVPVDAASLSAMSCDQLRDELDRVDTAALDAAARVDARFADNAALILISGLVWPAALALRADGEQARRLGLLKGRHEGIVQSIDARRCPQPVALSSPERADELALWPGDRYVYQVSGPTGAEITTRVTMVRAERIEMDGGAWKQDASGNRLPEGSVFESSSPPVDAASHRPALPYVVGLLKPRLRLGQALSGLLVPGEDTPALEVTAEVVGIGPATLARGSLPTVTLDLRGRVIEPATGNGMARATVRGVLVVDGRNGMLVRLQTQSSSALPAIDVRLLRVEPGQNRPNEQDGP